jgi:hypothetical protein
LAASSFKIGKLHAGEVIEIRVTSVAAAIEELQRLDGMLLNDHLQLGAGAEVCCGIPAHRGLEDLGIRGSMSEPRRSYGAA